MKAIVAALFIISCQVAFAGIASDGSIFVEDFNGALVANRPSLGAAPEGLFAGNISGSLGSTILIDYIRVGHPATSEMDGFVVAYYPYQKKLRAQVDLTGLQYAPSVTGADFSLVRDGSTEVLATGSVSGFINNKAQAIIDTPDLQPGTYNLRMLLQGGAGVPTDTFNRGFERRSWPWEHNAIGTSRVVVPPFTPLRVVSGDPPSVESVLRSHTMNGFGLWDQVRSKGTDILAGPIRYQAVAGGSQITFKQSPVKFTEESNDRVACGSYFEGGPIRGKAVSEFDYDGMMKVTLYISPRKDDKSANIDSLDLIIPVKPEMATLMHVVGDSIRANPAGSVSAGTGVVWDSKTQWISWRTTNPGGYGETRGTFVPYIWLGGIERGICWFADNDRDWSLDDNTAALDIYRDSGGIIYMRAHLFNKPTVLDRTRKIVFGLQATPVKPMPGPEMVNGTTYTWRSWSFHIRYPNSRKVGILANSWIWGGAEPENSVYPRQRDFVVYDEFLNSRTTHNSPTSAWMESWLDGYDDQSNRDEYQRNVANGFSVMSASDLVLDKVVPYTNPRGGEDSTSDEALNYNPRPLCANEWDQPKPSYQDYALFYFKKMIERGSMDGIYLDNVYVSGSDDVISSDAYLRDDGTIQPSMGLFDMRNLVKRIAVMHYELGKAPFTLAHMTNACIAPVLSFATIGLDLEWKYDDVTDFQDRFGRDLLQAQTTGLQCGVIPVILDGVVETSPDRSRLLRTEFGTTAVHETKIWMTRADADELINAYSTLFGFGYGLSDCTIYRYWDSIQHISIAGGDIKALAVVRPSATYYGKNKVMVVTTDFGDDPGTRNVAMMVDAAFLKLRAGFTARDAQTSQQLTVGANQVTFTLNKHDFKMIVME